MKKRLLVTAAGALARPLGRQSLNLLLAVLLILCQHVPSRVRHVAVWSKSIWSDHTGAEAGKLRSCCDFCCAFFLLEC